MKKSKKENNENKQNNSNNNIIKTNTLPIEQDPLFQKLYKKYNDGIDKYEFNIKQRIEKDPDFREFIARICMYIQLLTMLHQQMRLYLPAYVVI